MSSDASRIAKSNVNRSKSHERLIALWLTEWTGIQFRRRRVTGRDTNTRMLEMTADVIPLEGNFIFSVEAKCGKGFSLDALMGEPHKCLFTAWWHQTCYDASLATQDMGRTIYPMLFFRPGNNQNWVAVSSKIMDIVKHDYFPNISYNGYSNIGEVAGDVSHTKNKKIVKLNLDDVVMARWKDFSAKVDSRSVFV